MSPSRAKPVRRADSELFAALGNATRLRVLTRLARGRRCSLSQLTEGFEISRQAMAKHLRVLENAGLVRSAHIGRETQFEFDPGPLSQLSNVLNQLSTQRDDALARLKDFVEH